MFINQILTKLKSLVYSKSETDSLLNGKASSSHTHTKSQITDFPSLATVATSGSYSDLSNRSLLTVNGATSLGWSGIGGVANGSTLQLCTTDNTSPSICFHRSGHSHVVLAEAGGVLGIQAQGSDWLELATKSWVTSLGYITSSGSCNYANSAGNSDTLDGYHEYSFLRDRGGTSTSGEGTLWSQIGIKDYYNALPDGLNDVYQWGEVVSLAGGNARFDIYCSHNSSNGNGLYYRSGWDDDKKAWRCFIDSANIGSQSVNYANSSGNADTVDGSHAWQMQTLAAGGGVHGSNDWLMQCQHNVDGDGYFKLYCGDKSVGTKVDRANSSGWADSAGSVAWGNVSDRPWALSQFTNDSGFITSSGSCNYANSAGSAGKADYLGDIGSTDRNGASGTGWYSVGFSYSYDEGHGELAINNYWGIRLNCRDSNHVTINGNRIIDSANIGSQSVNYANSAGSAGSVAWGNVSDRPWAVSQFTNDSGFITSAVKESSYDDNAKYCLLYGDLLIQFGTAVFDTESGSITFRKAFSSAPIVIVNYGDDVGFASPCCLDEAYTTYFTVRQAIASAGWRVNWIAIGRA